MPLFVALICIIYLIKIKIIEKNNLNINYFFIIYFFYITLQLVGFYFSEINKFQNLFYLYLLFSSLIFFLYLNQFETKILKKVYIIYIIILFLIFSIYFARYFYIYIFSENISLYSYFPDEIFNPYLYDNLKIPENLMKMKLRRLQK